MNLTLQQLANLFSGQILAGDRERVLTGPVNTDSRKEVPDSLFFALSGDKFDGNDFACQAAEKGASVVVVSRPVELPAPSSQSCAVILVKDTLAALQQLAAWWRNQLTGIQVVGITGSNGKTSTKDFTRSILSQRFRTVATKGNLNNHIGVPLSILSTEEDTQAAIWEMGMSHPGELAPLCAMTRPQIGIITFIGTAHMEFMKTRQAIAEEKSTLGLCLPENGTLIFPANDDFADYLSTRTRAKILKTGGEHSPVRAENIRPTAEGNAFTLVIEPLGKIDTHISIPGHHMISNALLAAAAGSVLGLSLEEISEGLKNGELTKGRLRQWTYSGRIILDDTYNANPDSMKAALDTLAAAPLAERGRRIAVLGKMGELGDFSLSGHRSVGYHAVECGIDILLVVGEDARSIAEAAREKAARMQILFFTTKQEAVCWLSGHTNSGDILLFKGSRSAGMEDVMNSVFPPES